MPIIDGPLVNGLLLTPLVLPASVAGALAALFVVLVIMVLRRAGGGRWLSLPIATFFIGVVVVAALFDRVVVNNVAAERRALLARNTELTVSALTPGSALACLDGVADETIENACETALFADPQSTARAIAYTDARLLLLREVFDFTHNSGDAGLLDAFAATRRAIELDRYGVAAHVLSRRDGCTMERCNAFALIHDAGVLKANLKARAFEQYVSRYAVDWNKAGASNKQPGLSTPASTPPPVASAAETAPSPGHPVDSRWDFPSAASIPPVNIMTSEPPALRGVTDKQTAPPSTAAEAGVKSVPVPPKRPQIQTTTAPPAH